MKRILLASLLTLWTSVIVSAQTSVFYASPTWREVAQHHKTIAILPLEVHQQFLPKAITKQNDPAVLIEEQKHQVVEAQRAVRTYLLKRNRKKNLGIDVQEVEQTNALLLQNGLTTESIATLPPQQLAALLGVDAIITGKYSNTPPWSRNTAFALGAMQSVTGVGVYDLSPTSFLTVVLHDGATGERIWQFDRKTPRGTFAGTTKQIVFMMQSSKHKFPYLRKQTQVITYPVYNPTGS